MSEIKEELMEIWRKEREYLESIDPKETELYKAQLNRITEIEKRITDIETEEIKSDNDEANRKAEAKIKSEQVNSEKEIQKGKNRTEKFKVGVTVTAALLTAVGATLYENSHIFGGTSIKSALKSLLNFK